MDAMETMRVIINNPRKTKKEIAKDQGDNTSKTPAEVAIPLPPLNFSQQEKLCPKIAETPAMMARILASFWFGAIQFKAIQQAKDPFKMSRKSTAMPADLPRIRSALVAPMLPLPSFCRSIPRHFPAKNPKGIEPRK